MLRQELLALKPNTTVNTLCDDVSSLSDKLSRLSIENEKLRAENDALNVRLEEIMTSIIENPTMGLAVGQTLALPPILRVDHTNFTYSLVGPQGTLANLLAASHLIKSTNGSISIPVIGKRHVENQDKSGTTHQKMFEAAAATHLAPQFPIDDWKELALFWVMLSAVVIYILVLLCMYFKKTAESQLRGQEKRSTKNAAIAGWWKYRELEREEKAIAEAGRQKAMKLKRKGRDAGVDAICGFATS